MGEPIAQPGILSRVPLRKVNSRGSRNITGFVCSRKMPGLALDRESPNELAFLRRAEIDPRITEIYSQPILVEFRDVDGRPARAYPDFAIVIDGATEIHEVKPDTEYKRPDVRHRLELVAQQIRRYGFTYSVALSSSLHRKKDEAAIDDAWRRISRDVDPRILLATDDALTSGPQTIGDVLAYTAKLGATIADFHAMLAHGRIRADMATRADHGMVIHGRNSAVWFDRLIPFNNPLGDHP